MAPRGNSDRSTLSETDFLNRTGLLKTKSDQKVAESAKDAIPW